MRSETDTYERLKALDAVRWIACLVESRYGGSHGDSFRGERPDRIFAARWPQSPHVKLVEQVYQKAAVPAATPSGWGSGLMPTTMGTALIAFGQSFSVVSRLGAQRVPFRVFVPSETQPMSTVGWVGPGRAKVAIRGFLDRSMLDPYTLAGILVVSLELLRLTNDATIEFLRNRIARGIASFIDAQFVDPTLAASTNNPASITNGLTPLSSSGATADDALADVQALLAQYVSLGGRVETAAFLLSSTNAVALRLSGHRAFEDLTREGGTLGGIPALASDGIGANFVLVDAQRILLADDGEVDFDLAEQATLEMSDAPTGDSGVPTGAPITSLWQTDSAAIRARRVLSWTALENAAAYVADADYLAGGSPVSGSP